MELIENEKEENKQEKKPIIIRNSVDLQRLKLEKLMANPDKPVIIPERPKERGIPIVPDFVRNVMGSSAGAGSGEFHVYRHLRRKEYARQKYMKEKAEREKLDNDYHQKLEENKRKAEELTAKKRQKRLKKKKKQKKKAKKPKLNEDLHKSESSSEDSGDENSDSENISSKETEKSEDDADVKKDSCENIDSKEEISLTITGSNEFNANSKSSATQEDPVNETDKKIVENVSEHNSESAENNSSISTEENK